MNRPLTILLLGFTLAVTACKKERVPVPAPPPAGDDRSAVLLKDIVEVSLPSPYFHFSYNDSGYVKEIGFADGFFYYDVFYESKRVSLLQNRIDNSRLDYSYVNGKVARIAKSNGGKISWTYPLSYQNNQLKEVNWYRHEAGDSVLERKVVLFYGTDENLSSYEDYWRNGSGELKRSRTFVYSNYDKGTNVDDFCLFKNFFEDVLFLPGVKLQKNNPGLVHILGDQNDYEISYSYTYKNDLPIEKTGRMKQTRGESGNKEVKLTTLYSYY